MKSLMKCSVATALLLNFSMPAFAQGDGGHGSRTNEVSGETTAPPKKQNLVLNAIEQERAKVAKQEAAIKEITEKIESAELRGTFYTLTAGAGGITTAVGFFDGYSHSARGALGKTPFILMILGAATLVASGYQLSMTAEQRSRALEELKDAHDQLNTSKDYLNKVEAEILKK